jgi:hypothetical protein
MVDMSIHNEYDVLKIKPCENSTDKEKKDLPKKQSQAFVNESLEKLNSKVNNIGNSTVAEIHDLDTIFKELDLLIKTAILLDDSNITLGSIYKLLGRLERVNAKDDQIKEVLSNKLKETKQSILHLQHVMSLKNKFINPEAVFPVYFSGLIKPKLALLAKIAIKKKFLGSLPNIKKNQ